MVGAICGSGALLGGVALLTWSWTAPSAADVGAGHESLAGPPRPRGGPFAGRIAIRGGRKIYLECRGSGRPTVMLEAGTGNLGSIWTDPRTARDRRSCPPWHGSPACAYDRPGTYTYPDTFSRSDPVAMPRTTLDIVRDLNALLRAAGAPAPSCWPATPSAAWSRASTRLSIPGRSPGWSRSTLRTRTTPPP